MNHHDEFVEIREEIAALKKERNAVILVHNYQRPEIQDIGDHVEDSLGLARAAASTEADVILFCGVHFMAETAAMLNPGKTVLLPDLRAGCPMADMITPEALKALKEKHPRATVMCYINSSAAVKAECDICCTSSNALQIAEKIPNDEIIFVPDRSLAAWVAARSKKTFFLHPGYCPTHHRLREEDVVAMKEKYPGAFMMAHPECTEDVLSHADFTGSTSAMITFARTSPHREFLVGTESGILHGLQKENPEKTFHLLSEKLVCPDMKLTTMEKVLRSLQDMKHRVTVPPEIAERALTTIEKMLALS